MTYKVQHLGERQIHSYPLSRAGQSVFRYRIMLLLWGGLFCVLSETKTQPPCPGNKTLNADAGSCDAVVTGITIPYTVTDYVLSGATSESGSDDDAEGKTFNVGTTTVTYTYEDNGTQTCSFDITVEDAETPTAVCRSGLQVRLGSPDNGELFATTLNNGSFDNCPGTLTYEIKRTAAADSEYDNKLTFGCSEKGTVGVTLRVTDPAGKSATCSTTVSVVDNIAPTAGCQNGLQIWLGNPDNGDLSAITLNDGSSDNCPGTLTYEIKRTAAADSEYASQLTFAGSEKGTVSVTLRVTDPAGNAGTCDATVTVIDNIAPTAVCQNGLQIRLGNPDDGILSAVTLNNGSSDNCPGTLTYEIKRTADADSEYKDKLTFDCTEKGTVGVTLRVTDPAGNSATCSTTVSVVDNIAPTAGCQDGLQVRLGTPDNGILSAVTLNDGSFDNCPGTLTYEIKRTADADSEYKDKLTFDCTEKGTVDVTLRVTDPAGNAGTCDATVSVVDNIAPKAVCQNGLQVRLGTPDNGTLSAITLNNGSSDNCPGTLTYEIKRTGDADSEYKDKLTFDCTEKGTVSVTLRVTDLAGNSGTCNATVTVMDNINPVARCKPATVYLDGTGKVTLNPSDIDNGSSDNCGIVTYVIKRTGSSDPFASSLTPDCNDLEVLTDGISVTLRVEDASGNFGECDAVVTVLDDTKPKAVCKPATVYLDGTGTATLSPSDIDDGSSDNCGIKTYTIKRKDGADPFASSLSLSCNDLEVLVGDISVTLRVEDASGNFDECDALVTVIDNINPTAVCKSATVYLDGTGYATLNSSDIDDGSSDNCAITTFVRRTGSSDPFASSLTLDCNDLEVLAGKISVTLRVEDASGNSDECDALVTVIDNIVPTAVCKNLTLRLDETTGLATLLPSDIDDGSSDNCAITNRLIKRTGSSDNYGTTLVFDCNDVTAEGGISVTLRIEDVSENFDECDATITVEFHDGKIPNPTVSVDPVNKEICSGGTATLTLSDPDFDAATEWSWYEAIPSGITQDASSIAIPVISFTFSNSKDIVDTVKFSITPKIYQKCVLPNIPTSVIVNPQPKIIAIRDTSICDNTQTLIPIETSSVISEHASVYYGWTISTNTNVTGQSASGSEIELTNDALIRQTLDNHTVSYQEITYAMHPSLHLNGNVCPSPDNKQTVITVEPTPIIQITASQDTICNSTPINFSISSLNQSKGLWESDLDVVSENNTDVTPPAIPQPKNGTFSQTITNNALGVRRVRYTFKPQIKIKQDSYCRAPENDTLVLVAVNPTPVMTTYFPEGGDSICYRDGTELRMNSGNRSIIGTLRYDLWKVDYNAGTVLNVAEPDTVDFTGQSPNRGAMLDQTSIQNISDAVQAVTYSLYPVIEYRSLHCPGTSVDKVLRIAPELKFELEARTYIGGRNIQCYGEKNGKLWVKQPKGGWPLPGRSTYDNTAYNYAWNVVTSNTDTIRNLPASAYGVTVSDKKSHGCHAQKDTVLTQPDKLIAPTSNVVPDCNGPTGSITIFASGGTRGYAYLWCVKPDGSESNACPAGFSPPSKNDSAATNLRAGTYYIAVVDTNTCRTDILADLPYDTGGSSITAGWNKSTYGQSNVLAYNISCYGAKNGSLNPSLQKPALASVVSYTWIHEGGIYKTDTVQNGEHFVWSGGRSDITIENLGPGNYELSLTDDRGCEYHGTQTITEPPRISFTYDVPLYDNGYEVECDSTETGRISISNVSGGYGTVYGPYEYLWTPPNGGIDQRAAEQPHLSAGTYTVKIISKGVNWDNAAFYCDTSQSFTLREPPPVDIQAVIPDMNGYRIACYGYATGAINLNVSGGDETFAYQWSTADGSGLNPQARNQTGLTVGTYSVDVFYYGGRCVKTRKYALNQPTEIEGNAQISTIKCHGDQDASIVIQPTGGVTGIPYTYLWSSPDASINGLPTDQNQYYLGAGTYWLTITDQNECIKTETYTLTEPDPVTADLTVENVSCRSDNAGYNNDGTIVANVTGGTPEYKYLWDTGATTSIVSGLAPGTYFVTITDAYDCQVIAGETVETPPAVTVTAIATPEYNGYNIDCYGNSTGKISVDVQNGRPPYTYQWSSGNTSAEIDRAKAGTYSVTVTDRFNCKGNDQVTLIQPDKLQPQAVTSDITCPSGDDGKIQMIVTGGVIPYRYAWLTIPEDNTPIADRLSAGKYTVHITDNNECYADVNVTLNQPPPFDIRFNVTDPFCPDMNNGEIRTSVSGGTPSYKYLWPRLGDTSPDLADVGTGSYTLEVTDSRDCKVSETVEVGYRSPGCLKIPNAFSPNDDGTNDRWEITVGDPESAVRYQLRDLYPDAVIEIYSANWGILLYRSQKGYPEPWDGKYRGKYLPVNSYLYIIKLNDTIKPITGNVTIIR